MRDSGGAPAEAGGSETLAKVTQRSRKLEQADFEQWADTRSSRVAERWLVNVRARQGGLSEGVEGLLARFFACLTAMLPSCLGPYREQVEGLWLQASELYGSVAAQRGLAAGEAVEEFQVVREVLIREIYADPPTAGRAPMLLRDLLRLNRLIDSGVAQASVGHADALFFSLFQGSGVPEHLSEEVRREVAAELEGIREEFESLIGPSGR